MKRLLALTFALTAIATTAMAATVSDGTFRGRTSQGFKTKVVVDKGQVQLVLVPWKARRCKPHDGYVIKFPRFVYTNTPDAPIEQPATLGRFHDSGRVVDGPPRNRAVVFARLTGHFVGSDRVEGTQTIRVRTHDKYGRHRCTAKIHWFAAR
jgi:hypothetical protein